MFQTTPQIQSLKMQLQTCLILWLLIKFSTLTNVQECYLKIKQTNSSWKLAMEDNFENGDLNPENWDVENELENHKCHGNYIEQDSCNRRSNVQVQYGFLILQAKQESYNRFNFSSATVTSKMAISYGRVEFRATQPIGHQIRTSISTKSPEETYWHEMGQIEMSVQKSNLYRAVYYANSSNSLDSIRLNDGFAKLSNTMNEFHLYGFEWEEKKLRFFFDDIYTQTFTFNETHHLSPSYQIKLQIGVGLKFLDEPIPKNFNLATWKCPNFIIDYVRYYEKVDVTENQISKLCKISKDLKQEKAKLEKICLKSVKSNEKFISEKVPQKDGSHLVIIGIVITFILVLFIGSTAYVLIQLRNVRTKVHEQSNELTQIAEKEKDQKDHFYLNIHGENDEGIYSMPEYEDPESQPTTEKKTTNSDVQIDKLDKYEYVKPDDSRNVKESNAPCNDQIQYSKVFCECIHQMWIFPRTLHECILQEYFREHSVNKQLDKI